MPKNTFLRLFFLSLSLAQRFLSLGLAKAVIVIVRRSRAINARVCYSYRAWTNFARKNS